MRPLHLNLMLLMGMIMNLLLVSESCIKFHFSNIDEKEMKNVNKRSRRTSKHVELWARNAFLISEKCFVVLISKNA